MITKCHSGWRNASEASCFFITALAFRWHLWGCLFCCKDDSQTSQGLDVFPTDTFGWRCQCSETWCQFAKHFPTSSSMRGCRRGSSIQFFDRTVTVTMHGIDFLSIRDYHYNHLETIIVTINLLSSQNCFHYCYCYYCYYYCYCPCYSHSHCHSHCCGHCHCHCHFHCYCLSLLLLKRLQ